MFKSTGNYINGKKKTVIKHSRRNTITIIMAAGSFISQTFKTGDFERLNTHFF